jgi:flavoprotein hydroxylase
MLKAEGRPELALPPIPPPVLGPGVLSVAAEGAPAGIAGQLSPQGRVRTADGMTGLFDQVAATGFVLLGTRELFKTTDDSTRASLARLGVHVVHVLPLEAEPGEATDGVEAVVDVDGTYQRWLGAAGYEAVVIRPDFYVFGGVASAADLPALLKELFVKVGLNP